MIVRWCVIHNEHESADGIGYCWMAAVPYTTPDPCEFRLKDLSVPDDMSAAEEEWEARLAGSLERSELLRQIHDRV